MSFGNYNLLLDVGVSLKATPRRAFKVFSAHCCIKKQFNAIDCPLQASLNPLQADFHVHWGDSNQWGLLGKNFRYNNELKLENPQCINSALYCIGIIIFDLLIPAPNPKLFYPLKLSRVSGSYDCLSQQQPESGTPFD